MNVGRGMLADLLRLLRRCILDSRSLPNTYSLN
jgi:hypothetical protein